MSSQWWKKDAEERSLALFLAEYRAVTGTAIKVIASTERPDFICQDDSGSQLGVELVRVMVDPETRMWREILDREEFMDPTETAIRLQEIVYQKEQKRASSGWQHSDRTILVLDLHDAPVPQVASILEDDLLDEMSETGFREIWVSDHTIEDSYYTVQLFGIKPREWRGLHPHHSRTWKPYG